MAERSIFGGWEQVPGKPGEYRAKSVIVPATKEFSDFSSESRARWDIVEYLKTIRNNLLNKKTSTKK